MTLTPMTRRILLGATAGLAAATVVAPTAEAAPNQATVPFTPVARVGDGGQEVLAFDLDLRELGPVRRDSITTGTFGVHALAVAPLAEPVTIVDGTRPVTSVRVSRHRVTLELGQGCPTVGYIGGTGNVMLDLTFTLTLSQPIVLRRGGTVTEVTFRQRRTVDAEVDRYRYATAANGIEYRLFAPARRRGAAARPMVVWLHGAGESGQPAGLPTNETQLRANRCALGFSTPEAQAIFGGAYVLAPQAPAGWSSRIAGDLMALIREVAARHRVDPTRIHLGGNSSGGTMTLRMGSTYPDFFASCLPVCPPVHGFSAADLARLASTPTWFVTAANDSAVPAEPNAVAAHRMVPGSILSLYPDVVWNGHVWPSHWSWIYVTHNDPRHDGERLWQWMARQRRTDTR